MIDDTPDGYITAKMACSCVFVLVLVIMLLAVSTDLVAHCLAAVPHSVIC